MRYRVTQAWQASYDDPIRLSAGDPVWLTGRQERWEGHLWLWARASDGREGWVPDSVLQQDASGTVSREDYSAEELTCAPGEVLDAERETHGWLWCRNGMGDFGWVPRRNLFPTGGD